MDTAKETADYQGHGLDPVANDDIREGTHSRQSTKRQHTPSECDDHIDRKRRQTEEMKEEIQLSESIFIYPNRKISDHANVLEGEIRSGVYGVRVCAIKFARKSKQNVTEAKILTKLCSHTHVVSIIQSGIYEDAFEDRVFIAMDKCHEQNLHQHITHQKASGVEFNLNKALEYSKQIVAGVTYIHENLIIHKDLKPANILLSHDKSTIKLADFGLSQEIKSTSSKVYNKHQFGTNGFRPIESFGSNWVSLKSDIYSLGVVLYFVLSNGKSPFGDVFSLWIYNAQNGVIDLSQLLVPNKNSFQHLIKLMLSSERCRRPSIWEVAGHPVWSGKEVECNFDYGFTQEINDSDDKVHDDRNQDSRVSESEIESRRQLLRALQKMGYDLSPKPETSIIIFDGNSEHLQLFNLKDKSLTQMHELNEEMNEKSKCLVIDVSYFSSVWLDDYIYILADFSLYRLKYGDVTASWEQMAHPIYDLESRPRATAASGSIYVVGAGGGKFTKTVSKFDPSVNRWEILRRKYLATNSAAVVASEGFIYCIGGYAEMIGLTDRVEKMDVDKSSWSEVAPMRKARSATSSVECDGKIIVAGGVSRGPFGIDSVEKYDPDVDQWTIMKPMMKGRNCFRCHFVEGKVYTFGGSGCDSIIERYDVEKDEWEFFHDLGINVSVWGSVAVKMEK